MTTLSWATDVLALAKGGILQLDPRSQYKPRSSNTTGDVLRATMHRRRINRCSGVEPEMAIHISCSIDYMEQLPVVITGDHD